MALSPPAQTAESTLYSGTATFAGNITAGHGVVVLVSVSGGTITGISGSDTWTTVTLVSTYLYAVYVPASVGGYKTITVTSGATVIGAVAYEIPAAIRLDNSSGAGGGPATSWSSGSFTSTVAAEIWLGIVQVNQYTPAGPGLWNELALIGTSGGAMILSGWGGETVTGTAVYNGTVPAADYYSAGVLAFHSTVTTVPGAGAFAGSGALGAAGQLAAAGTAGLSGAGSLTAAASGSAVLAGTGTLGVTGVRVAGGAAGLSGTGVLTSTGTSSGASLAGTGALGATGVRTAMGAAVLSGTGALSGYEQLAALSGLGALSGAAAVFAPPGAAALTGTGALGVSGLFLGYTAGLSGQGALAAFQSEQLAFLSGTGAFGVTGERLGFAIGMTGIGYLSVPQVTGGLVGGVGGAGTPQALPGSSQVAVALPGSAAWRWLGTLGQVTALTYSFVCPGGCDQMTCTVMVPAVYRTQLFSPGWQVKVVRGGHDVWHGKLDEPVPTASGWNLTAVGTGNLGTNFLAYYAPGDTWPTGVADDIMNRAIARGLPWVSPGMAASPYYSQFWFGQQVDPGAQTVTAFLNLICTRGALTWYVNSQPGGSYLGDDLQVFPLPATPNRLLVATTPVARTLGGDVNTIFIRYESAADNTTTSTAASYNVVSVANAQSVAAHGVLETYIDLSDAGVLTSAAAQAVGSYVLSVYQRASFAGPFQASYGQLLNSGGQPVDPGTDQAGTMVRMILSDYAYGGEVVPGPITWITGAYSWDDFAQVATITPYQSFDQSLTGMLSVENTVLTPITAAST